MPAIPQESQTMVIRPRGGINLTRPEVSETPWPDRWLDLFNMVPTPYGIRSAPGWAARGNELATASGTMLALFPFATTAEGSSLVAVSTIRFFELASGTWTNRQGATGDFGMAATDHPDSTFYSDVMYVSVPVTGAANAIRQWTGAGNNITALAGSPRNARWIEWFGDYLLTAGTFSGAGAYDATKIYRSSRLTPTTSPGKFTDMMAEPSPVMKILRLGQIMMVYKQYSIATLEVTGEDVLPFEPDQLPSGVGLALPEAVAQGGRFHAFMAADNFYLIDMLSPTTLIPIGDAISREVQDNLAAGTTVLAGYDNRSPQHEAFWFLTNYAMAAGKIGPNSAATTNTYWMYDVTTKSWSRGDLGANRPRCFGNYLVRYGFRDEAPISLAAGIFGMDSSGGTTAYEIDYATANRVGAAFTRRALSPIFAPAGGLREVTVDDVIPILNRKSSGTVSISWKLADQPGEVPVEKSAPSFNLDGTSRRALLSATAPYHQFEITATNDLELDAIEVRYRMRR